MNNKQYHFIIDILNILLNFLASFAVIGIGIIFTTQNTGYVYKTFILLPAPVISYLIVRYTKHIWSFLVLHISMAAIYIFTNHNGFVIAFYFIYLVLLMAFALNNKLKTEVMAKSNTPLIFLTPFIAMYFLNNYLGITNLNSLVFLLVLSFILLYLFNLYLINFERFFQTHSNLTNVPIKRIQNTNHILLLFFSCLCVATMFIFTKFPLKAFLAMIGNLLLGLIRAFFSLFEDKDITSPIKNIEPEQGAEPLGFLKANPPSVIWQYIENILLGLFTIALYAGVIALILYGLYRLYQLFYEKKYNNYRDKTEFISPFDKRESLKREEMSKVVKKLFPLFGRSNNEKIRKYFYKGVITHNDTEKLSGSLTPMQLSQYALNIQTEHSGDDIIKKESKKLAEFYEKARYSKDDCTKEDVIQVKNILKKTLP